MIEIKPDIYTQKELLNFWIDKKKYLIDYRLLKLFVRHGMIVDKFHEMISFKQRNWLEKCINLKTQKVLYRKMILKKTSRTYSITHFIEKHWKMYEIGEN